MTALPPPDELRALREAATPGPWESGMPMSSRNDYACPVRANGKVILSSPRHETDDDEFCHLSHANAELAALAPALLEDHLARVEREAWRDKAVAWATREWERSSGYGGPFHADPDFFDAMLSIGFMEAVKVTKKNLHDYEAEGWELGDVVFEWTKKAFETLQPPRPEEPSR